MGTKPGRTGRGGARLHSLGVRSRHARDTAFCGGRDVVVDVEEVVGVVLALDRYEPIVVGAVRRPNPRRAVVRVEVIGIDAAREALDVGPEPSRPLDVPPILVGAL